MTAMESLARNKLMGLFGEKSVSAEQVKQIIRPTLEIAQNVFDEFENIDTLNYKFASWWTQNHIQPIQVIYFDVDSNKSVAAFFNCIAETNGISKMTWNKDKELEQFPPIAYRKWCDSLFSYNEILNTIVNLKTGKNFESVPRKKYLILVLYSLFIEKQTLNLFREVKYNLSKQKSNNYEIYYVNMDNYFYSELKK